MYSDDIDNDYGLLKVAFMRQMVGSNEMVADEEADKKLMDNFKFTFQGVYEYPLLTLFWMGFFMYAKRMAGVKTPPPPPPP